MNRVLFALLLLPVCSSYAENYVVGQKDKAFIFDGKVIDHLKITVGDSVEFRNEDPFFHNVFSVSPGSRFDSGFFPQGESRSVIFDKQGEVEVECSIHPNMHLKVEVVSDEQ